MFAAFALAAAIAAQVDWLALPIASYNSDDGLAGGVVVQAQWLGKVAPYKAALGAQVLFSTGGVQSHYLRLDVPRLFGSPLRLWMGAEFHKELNAPYYGLGNNTSSDLALHPELFGNHPFSYLRRYPQANLAFTLPFSDSGVRLSAFVRYLRLHIEEYDGSLLALQRPPGSEGGEELSFGFGVLLDRRKGEAMPTKGYLLEAALRGSQRGMASEHSYLGGTALATAEVRIRVADARLLDRRVSFGTVAFFDTGRVWQLLGNDGAFFDFHSGYGGGLRVYHREFVLRLDVGTSSERAVNFYITFGSFF